MTDHEERMLAHSEAGRHAWRDLGDLAEAEREFLLAWEAIPSPKDESDWAGSFATGFLDFYIETGQPEKAVAWLPTFEELYGDDVNLHMWQGIVHFELGEQPAAYAAFKRAHDAYGYRPFREEDQKYWKFYRDYVAG